MQNFAICPKCFQANELNREICWKCLCQMTKPLDPKDIMRLFSLRPSWDRNDLKAAFHMMARKFHPDVNPGNPEAAAYFKFVNAGYESLCGVADEKARIESHGQRDGRFQEAPDLGMQELNEKLRAVIRDADAKKNPQVRPTLSILNKFTRSLQQLFAA